MNQQVSYRWHSKNIPSQPSAYALGYDDVAPTEALIHFHFIARRFAASYDDTALTRALLTGEVLSRVKMIWPLLRYKKNSPSSILLSPLDNKEVVRREEKNIQALMTNTEVPR
ncbi:MAG: hypothetical protein AAF598_07165 [Bacteroidota bacterium]